MSDIKRKLLQELDKKTAQRKAIQAAQANSNIENFVLDFIKEMEDLRADVDSSELNNHTWRTLVDLNIGSLRGKVITVDPACRGVDIIWRDDEDGGKPSVESVLIKWSTQYQAVKNCDPEQLIDIVSLLFR